MHNRITRNAVVKTVALFCLLFCGAVSIQADAQERDIRGRQLRPGSPFGTATGDTYSLLIQKSIIRDLELTDEQLSRLREVKQDHDAMIKEVMQEYRTKSKEMAPQDRIDYLRGLTQKRKESRDDLENKINDVLLPFQLDRIEQIKVQFRLSRMPKDSASPLLNPLLREKLNMDPEQIERIQEKIKQVQKKLEEDIARLREKARDEIMEELTEEQKQTYEEIVGEPLTKYTGKDN